MEEEEEEWPSDVARGAQSLGGVEGVEVEGEGVGVDSSLLIPKFLHKNINDL